MTGSDWTQGPRDHGKLAAPNHLFGTGALRRRIRLLAQNGLVRAGVEDSYHSFRLALRHDGKVITRIDAQGVRFPLSTCPGAVTALRDLEGESLTAPPIDVAHRHAPRSHCTHLYDLTLLAMAHALRKGSRQYDVEIPDEHPDPVWSRVWRDGIEIHCWRTFNNKILAPRRLADHPMLRGFSLWASRQFAGDALEAAHVLHKGYFVSRARPWDVDADAGQSVAHHQIMVGKCYSYSPAVMATAIRQRGMTIDTSDQSIDLLPDLL